MNAGGMAEKTIMITGATDGLGRALARRLAEDPEVTLLLHGRDDARGAAAVAEVRDATGNPNLHWYRADLASLAQVRSLAAAVAADHPRLGVLVNNAGLGISLPEGRQVSADGHELRFAVNYLAGYLLTRLLLPVLRAGAPSRVVLVSSAGQQGIDFDDVMLTRGYSGGRAYCQSKLAQVMFGFDLADELSGTGVTVTSLHPGTFLPTKMVRAAGITPLTPVEDGVRATARLAVGRDVSGVTGKYFNGLREARAEDQAYDVTARSRLRELSDELVSGYAAPLP